ncbi:hypothetical protein F4818DRAFT_457176 [Hypoxylon cercidicola]|nr:hypothetical protein F4818DRAFT_457176 [Hypoxylon cercidicola]
MSFAPNKPSRRSKRLPRELEDQLKDFVFDAGDGPYMGMPQLIIGNAESCCHGVCHIKSGGIEFMFHHAKGKYNTECGCIIKCEPNDETLQLPAELELHRLKLMFRGPYKMEAKFAAIVVMKLFLGIEVPKELRIKPRSTTEDADPQEQGEQGEQKGASQNSE